MFSKRVPFLPFTVPVAGPIEDRINVVRDLVSAMNKTLQWDEEKVKASILVKPYELGLTNQLYKCELDPTKEEYASKNMEVMVRVFGQGSDQMLDRVEELNIMTQVQEDYVRCRFDNGIVVKFFPGRCLRPLDLLDEDKKQKIIEQMVKLHKIRLVGSDGDHLDLDWFDRVETWINIVEQKLPNFQLKATESVITIKSLRNELQSLKAHASSQNYEKVCSHGDINAENCIYNEKDGSITFIDYEYACNFYKGFDIGNHFCEYAGVERDLDFATYLPSVEQQRSFVVKYCRLYYHDDFSEETVNRLVEESDFGMKCSHLFWGIWGVVQSTCSQLDFDFLSYGTKRLIWLFQK